MYRFLLRPRWIVFHIAIIAAVVGMLALANWQWTRLQQRNDFIAKVHHREETEPQALAPLLATNAPADIEYLKVTATGSYLTTGQMIQINQVQAGVNGSDVLTPFQIDGGPLIIVNRGFIEDNTAAAPPPTGTLLIGGTARTTQPHTTGELTDNNSGDKVHIRRVDLGEISKRLGVTVAPIYLDFIAAKPTTTEPPIPPPAPDLSGGPPHLSYTIQWLIFSLCAIAGWVFAVRRSARTRLKKATATAVATAPADAGSNSVPDSDDSPPRAADEQPVSDARAMPSA